MCDLTIAIPVKDGEAWLDTTLDDVDAYVRNSPLRCEVIVVDDGSQDHTARILAKRQATCPYLKVLTHPENRGKGAALKTGIAASVGAVVLAMDADATYSLEALPRCFEKISLGYDVAIGNRRAKSTRFILHPSDFLYVALRHAIGAVFSALAAHVVGLRVHDSQCGFKVYRGEVARRVFGQLQEEKFAADVEIIALLQQTGASVAEVPVVYVYRRQQTSVRLVRDGLRMGRSLFRIRRRMRRQRRSGAFADPTRPDYQYLALRRGHPVQRFWHRKKTDLVTGVLEIEPGDRVMDVGAGSAEVAATCARTASLVCAVDESVPTMIFMRTTRSEDGARLQFVAADMCHLPFRSGTFNKITALELIEHVAAEKAPVYLAELRRVLLPRGRVLFTTPNYRSYWPLLERAIDHFGGAAHMGGSQHVTRFSARSLPALLETNGFTPTVRGTIYHLSPFLAPLFPALAERVFQWEIRRRGNWGPIAFCVARSASEAPVTRAHKCAQALPLLPDGRERSP